MLAFALALHLSASAFACDGDEDEAGGKKSCPMPAAETTAAVPTTGTHVALTVTGMHCGGCANAVHEALMGVDGVTGAQVVLETGAVQVAYDAKKVTTDKLLAAVTALGEFQVKLATN